MEDGTATDGSWDRGRKIRNEMQGREDCRGELGEEGGRDRGLEMRKGRFAGDGVSASRERRWGNLGKED